ncbi:hypothetical protein DFJ74DRAFT_679092 [Hyaloraphidium curvatum]|nr:hypothetical protein DFJ74DRAFT_679092 [Hyaloraphidium curvatum]
MSRPRGLAYVSSTFARPYFLMTLLSGCPGRPPPRRARCRLGLARRYPSPQPGPSPALAGGTPRMHHRHPVNNGQPLHSAGDAYLLEQENEEHVESLQQKLGVLKEVSLQIGEEVRSQSEWFKQMQDDMYRTGGILGTTMGRLTHIMKTQAGCWMCILMAFAVSTLTFLWFYLKLFR